MKLFKFTFLSFAVFSFALIGCNDSGPDFEENPTVEKKDVEFKFFRLEERNGAELKSGSPMFFQIGIVTEIGLKSLKASIIDSTMNHTQLILDDTYEDSPLKTITLQNTFELDNFSIPELEVKIEAVDINDKYYSLDTSLSFSDYLTYVGEVVLLDSLIGYVNTDNIHYLKGLDLVNNYILTSGNPGSTDDWDITIRTTEDLAKSGRPLHTQVYRFREPQNSFAMLNSLNNFTEADLRAHNVDESIVSAQLQERLSFYEEDNFTGGWMLVKLRDNKFNKKWSLLYVYDVYTDVENPVWNKLVGKTKYKARLYERPYIQ